MEIKLLRKKNIKRIRIILAACIFANTPVGFIDCCSLFALEIYLLPFAVNYFAEINLIMKQVVCGRSAPAVRACLGRVDTIRNARIASRFSVFQGNFPQEYSRISRKINAEKRKICL